jgi:hypothetical protein
MAHSDVILRWFFRFVKTFKEYSSSAQEHFTPGVSFVVINVEQHCPLASLWSNDCPSSSSASPRENSNDERMCVVIARSVACAFSIALTMGTDGKDMSIVPRRGSGGSYQRPLFRRVDAAVRCGKLDGGAAAHFPIACGW